MWLTKEYVLERVADHEIFERYFGSFRLKKDYISPFREEKHPSFGFYRSQRTGRVRFKDFGGDEGDCFDFVKKKFGVDFHGALAIIAQDFNILPDAFGELPPRRIMEPVHAVKAVEPRMQFEYRVKPYPEFGTTLDVWSAGGITLDILQEYDVKNIEWYSFIAENGRKIIRRAAPFDPIYAFEYGDDVVRFYRPNTKNRALKWMGNTRYHDIFGLKQIKERVPLCGILAGQKDAMSLWANTGIRAVSLSSESTHLTEGCFERIKEKSDQQFVLYDNDKPSKQYPEGQGMHFAKKIRDKYGIPIVDIRAITSEKDTFDYFKHVIRIGLNERLSELIYDSIH